MKTLSAADAQKHLNDKTLWIDVRSPGEFRGEHMEQSRNIPLDHIQRGQHEDLGENADIVVSCASGKRSETAAKILSEKLGRDVYSLEGGIEVWKSAGHPTVKGKGTISIERQVRIGAGAIVAVFSILGWTVSPGFLGVPVFVGCGLVFAGITDFCGMGILLSKMPWNR